MAESIGLEPMHPKRDDRLAICCITTLPTLHQVRHNIYNNFFPSSIYFFVLQQTKLRSTQKTH